MTEAEIIQQLRAVRFGRTPSIRSIAIEAGMPRELAYVAMRTGHVPESHRAALAAVIQRVMKGQYYNPRSQGR